MGYTHYWYLNTKGNEKNYQKAKKAIRKIIKENMSILANGIGEGNPVIREVICFNGKGNECCETFFLPKNLPVLTEVDLFLPGEDPNYKFNFCKTAHYPYDKVVVACLTVLKHYMKKDVTVTSNGRDFEPLDARENPELQEGIELARKILGINFEDPTKEFETPQSVQFLNSNKRKTKCQRKQKKKKNISM
jgi:hypothetical protein